MLSIKIREGDYQDKFLQSQSKFPAIVAGIGTGKTMCLLVKIYEYCERWPGTTGLLVRREFTDLKDSTMRDFENYFGAKIGSDKDFHLSNGSKIMFRHAAEIQVLKNINLGIAGIEQAEEFEDDTQFQFLRDRLRQNNGATVRPLCIIANANGHNWVYKLWINNPPSAEYEAFTATTFDNAHNLPPDFIADLKTMAVEAPNHYQQYVMNSFEQTEEDDFVYSFATLMEAKKREFALRQGYGLILLGIDVARYGNDKCAAVALKQLGSLAWVVSYVEQWEKKDLNDTTGRILDTANRIGANTTIIDEDGMGAGPLDFIQKGRMREDFVGFRNPNVSYEHNKFYGNARTENAFKIKEMIDKGWISIPDEALIEEMMTLRYKFMNDGRKILVSKEEMRTKGYKSPNMADAFIMAASLIGTIKEQQDGKYRTIPRQYAEDNLFALAGVR